MQKRWRLPKQTLFTGEMKCGNLREIAIPRNIQQLRNLCFKVLSEMVNLQMGCLIYISLLMDVRPRKIETYPDFVCILGLKNIMEEMDRVLQLNEVGQLLSLSLLF